MPEHVFPIPASATVNVPDLSRALIVCLALLFLGLSAAVAVERLGPPIRCERHAGAFSNDFSIDFDIDRLDCRIPWVARSPTMHVWGVAPYVGLDWGKVHFLAGGPYVSLDRGGTEKSARP
jgi:hypothetical protein